MEEEVTEQRFRMEPKNRGKNAQTVNDGNEAGTGSQNLENMNAEMSDTIETNLQDGWDNMEKVENGLAQAKETRDEQNGTKSTLVRDLLKGNEETYPLVGLPQRASTEIFGVLSPVTPKSGTTEDLKNKAQDLGSDGAKKTKASGKLKKVAREIGKRQIENKEAQVNIGGKKRAGFIESLEESEGRAQKRVCETYLSDDKTTEISAVAVTQHRREQC